jgi:hypothetical protein
MSKRRDTRSSRVTSLACQVAREVGARENGEATRMSSELRRRRAQRGNASPCGVSQSERVARAKPFARRQHDLQMRSERRALGADVGNGNDFPEGRPCERPDREQSL